MKKTLIATAIAGAMSFTAVAQAAEVDYDLYGSLRVAVVDTDNGELDVADNSSRIGIKASTQLDGGITGIVRFETYVNTESGDFGSSPSGKGRLAYIGATGDFGTVTAGRQWTPQYLWTSAKVDLLDFGSNPTHSYALAGRQGNTVAYITPDLSGLQLAAVLVARAGGEVEANTTEDGVDAYNLAAHYAMGGFSVGLSSIMYQGNIDENYTAFAVGYEQGPLNVAFEMTDNGIADTETFEVAGSYSLGKATVLANFVDFDDDNGNQVAAEVQYKLGAKSRVAATVVAFDDDAEDAGNADQIAVSWRVDF
ncbi:porin [Oceanospirillum sediminis]|uniref:Porin n=1 Tax=Oceanospirillum sediminis TaxID=2760088 RepID=A0A839ILC1_9GAMM|nr:porin [Oceanospirillum sediminis]MBB1485287.1 porin [Oceanospirillum sediminis]